MVDQPVWLMDVDGVLNVNRPGWGAAPRRGRAFADSVEWPMRWAPRLLARVRLIHVSGAAEVRWCTTWCQHADQLERLFGLPALARVFSTDAEVTDSAKVTAARAVIAEGRPLIWTDDTAVPRSGPLHEELTAAGRGLLVRPVPSRGLQPGDLDRVDEFVSRWT